MSRQQLAERGLQQTVDLLQASKQLLDSYSNIQVDTQSQQQLLDVQQRYQQVSQDIRQTLLQCQALEEQEAAAAVAGMWQLLIVRIAIGLAGSAAACNMR